METTAIEESRRILKCMRHSYGMGESFCFTIFYRIRRCQSVGSIDSGIRLRRTSSTESSLKQTMTADGGSGAALECCLIRKRDITKHSSARAAAGAPDTG